MKRNRTGFALVIVLILSGLILTTSTFLWRTNQDDTPRIQMNLIRLQTEFLAKGAQQVARLKFKLLPTPAYDAAAFAQGKNPYFDHSTLGYREFRSKSGGPADSWHGPFGPLFFTGTATDATDGTEGYSRTAVRDVSLNGTEGPEDQVGGVWIAEQHLMGFVDDLQTEKSPVVNGVTFQCKEGVVDPNTGLTDPFSGTFRVTKIELLGFDQGKKYNEEALRLEMTAAVTARVVGANTNITSRPWTQTTTAIYRVSRVP